MIAPLLVRRANSFLFSSFFETTIRYLASMLSAYELNGRKDNALLENAKKLGDKLMYSFTSDGPLPYGSLHFDKNTPKKPGRGGTVRLSSHRPSPSPAILLTSSL